MKKYRKYFDPIVLPNGVMLTFGRIQRDGKWSPVLHRSDKIRGVVLNEFYETAQQAKTAARRLARDIEKIYESGGVCG